MTTEQKYEFYAQAVGTNDVKPVLRVSRAPGRPPTMWCPFCDNSAQVGFSKVCPNCKALWLDGDFVDAAAKVAESLGHPLEFPVAPQAPEPPALPARDDDGGFSQYTDEQIAEMADKAHGDQSLDLMIRLSEELEDRHMARVLDAQTTTSKEVPTTDTEELDDEPPARKGRSTSKK